MILSVHQPQYLPWLGFFDKIRKSDCFVFLDRVQYKHREFQNRNKIRTKDSWIWLTVPVITKGLRNQLISDVKIDNSVDWQEQHYRSIKSCYTRARPFSDYAPFLEDTYLKKKWEKLADLNIFIIRYLLQELRIQKPLYLQSELKTIQTGTDRIIEICRKLKADTYLSGAGGKVYLEEGKFSQAGILLKYQDFKHPVYPQCFVKTETDFIPQLAAIDLLFNLGPEAKEILGRSRPS